MVAEASSELDITDRAAAAGERLLVEFELADERYGVDITDIREIIRYQAITTIPGTPEIVEGIINLRGRVTPIVDLRMRIGLPASEADDSTRIIVIDVDDALVGVHVDAVTGVVSLTNDQLQQLSIEATNGGSDYIEGVADIDGRLIILINLQRALEGRAEAAVPPAERPHELAAAAASAATAVEPGAEDGDTVSATPDTEPVDAEPRTDASALGLRVELLEQSFEAVKPHAEQLVALFYEKLFEQHPAVQPLFANTNMSEQQGKLLSALATVVASLRQPDVLVPHLEELGRRHVAYGAEPAHYEAVGTVLVETLGDIAGDLWTDELRDAWADAVTLVASVMIDAAAEVEVPAPPAVEAVEAPEAKKPAAKKPAARKAAAKKPATRKPTAKNAPAKKPAAKKPAAKKPATKKPAAKKPVARKRAAA